MLFIEFHNKFYNNFFESEISLFQLKYSGNQNICLWTIPVNGSEIVDTLNSHFICIQIPLGSAYVQTALLYNSPVQRTYCVQVGVRGAGVVSCERDED